MNRPGKRPYTAVLIVPTGIGAAIGGYAGDALPVARAIAQVVDHLITHPNVLNGAQLFWPLPNAFYVEGYGLDQFAAGAWGLRPVHQNRVGLILDRAIEPELRLRHLQAADATRATLGLDLTDYVVTDAPLGVQLQTAPSGATWGTIANPDSLLRAAEIAIQRAGAEAIAIVARFPDDLGSEALQHYRQGQGVDPLAGAEAVISHLVVRELRVPCAHAPALLPLPLDATLSPRAAAEELGYTFLPCVLAGLSRAPQFEVARRTPALMEVIWRDRVDAVIVPARAFGGSAVLSLGQRSPSSHHSPFHSPLMLAVGENQTRMQVPPEWVGISAMRVHSYLEAIGILAAHRAGIAPASLRAAIAPLRQWDAAADES
ncbi:MAG: DUF3326 domain-containing protein [Leptolyngbyaceae cyanobacterium bins.349]|nr:DUF3326 domain-containing protein [Leptolyngbyaceae cyanobacterium bins.349]